MSFINATNDFKTMLTNNFNSINRNLKLFGTKKVLKKTLFKELLKKKTHIMGIKYSTPLFNPNKPRRGIRYDLVKIPIIQKLPPIEKPIIQKLPPIEKPIRMYEPPSDEEMAKMTDIEYLNRTLDFLDGGATPSPEEMKIFDFLDGGASLSPEQMKIYESLLPSSEEVDKATHGKIPEKETLTKKNNFDDKIIKK